MTLLLKKAIAENAELLHSGGEGTRLLERLVKVFFVLPKLSKLSYSDLHSVRFGVHHRLGVCIVRQGISNAWGLGNSAKPVCVAKRLAEEDVLVHVVARLREIERSTGLERTLAIGELILNQFFGGDADIWRDRRRNKNNSIRRLAERPGCPYGKSALNEAVGVFVSARGLPCVRTFGHISSSHVAAVLRLPSSEQEPMLRKAEEQRWSVRELKREVVQANRSTGERRGRPALELSERASATLTTRIRDLELAIIDIAECGSALSQHHLSVSLARLSQQVERLKQLCLAAGGTASEIRLHADEPAAPGPMDTSARAAWPAQKLAG